MMNFGFQCPICNPTFKSSNEIVAVDCRRCGNFEISRTVLSQIMDLTESDRVKLMISVARSTRAGFRMKLDEQLIIAIIESYSKELVTTMCDNLVLLIAERMQGPGSRVEIFKEIDYPRIGAESSASFGEIMNFINEEGWIAWPHSSYNGNEGKTGAGLTLEGWRRQEILLSNRSESKKAFMAMSFRDNSVKDFYLKHVKQAIQQVGFEIEVAFEDKKQELIDSKIRVMILRSRFIVADLTDMNPNVMWEAGYAEGKGKPVFFTCRKDLLDQAKLAFDVRNHLITPWSPGEFPVAADELKNVIRATIPEATLE